MILIDSRVGRDSKEEVMQRFEGITPSFSCWVVRQKSTGKFLPHKWKSARGHSYSEPSFGFPRLFKSEKSARSALNAWSRGQWSEKEYDHDEWSHTDFVSQHSPVEVEGRDKNDMEVVQAFLEIGRST
jgi:hypothetical protein